VPETPPVLIRTRGTRAVAILSLVLFFLLMYWLVGGIPLVWYVFCPAVAAALVIPFAFLVVRYRRLALGETRLELRVPSRPFAPGEEIPVETVLRLGIVLPLNAIEIRFHGEETVEVEQRSGDEYVRDLTESHTIVDETRILENAMNLASKASSGGQPVLVPGTHSYATTFRVPSSAIGTYTGVNVRISYEVSVRVIGTRRLQLLSSTPLEVMPFESAHPSSPTEEPSSEPPRGGISIVIDAPGEVGAEGILSGNVALANLSEKEVRKIRISVVRIERGRIKGREVKAEDVVSTAELDWNQDRGIAEFHLDMSSVRPSFQGTLSSARYVLEARVNVRLGLDVRTRRSLLVLPPRRSGDSEQKTLDDPMS
jgi:hypothetical protein